MRILFPILVAGILFLALSPAVHASSPPSGHVVVYSSDPGSNDLLYVPVNSSGSQAYPDWHIFLYGSGSFSFLVNGTTMVSGVSLGVFNFTYDWTTSQGSYANATLVFGGVTYTFSTILTGQLSNQEISSVEVSSSYVGQDQFLTVSSGTSGALMYPHWIVKMESTQNVSYTINVNGQNILSGHILGSKVLDFNVSGSSATVTIGLGSKIFSYPNEIVATVPIQKYYGPKPPPLQYTLVEYEYGIARAFVASAFAILIALFTARKYLLEKERREVIRI
ncbi:MAG: hypothetical protein AMDU1_APLC00047G0016 [Thermoplasmatales archaeon A-plasma]|nr:MAG: hypothetical protein AMDU1_APLC00047G0016 [Thermoplasmatales archaeon A-plasma]